jgi:hypothetical protein
VHIKTGDALEVIGSRVMVGESHVVLARDVRKGDQAWTLRAAEGEPLITGNAMVGRLSPYWFRRELRATSDVRVRSTSPVPMR